MRFHSYAMVVVMVSVGLAGCLAGPEGSEALDDDGSIVLVRGQEPVLAGGDAPIQFLRIQTPEQIVEKIEMFGERPGVEVEVIGQSIFGRPIHLVSVGEGDFDLWIVGRHHGNEPTGAEAILLALHALTDPDPNLPERAPESFRQLVLQREELLDRLTFHFVPVANPDGSAAYTRGNAAQADLNREYFLFAQPEPVAVREAFWTVKPDGCLDLHNEGIGGTDWDAFGPDGPLIEPEIFSLMNRDVDFALFEVDASGGRGGDMNEFYNLVQDAPVVGPIVNPTAYHPGTHDMFCSLRGAPGYTPEGAIGGGGNGEGGPVFEWSTRLHQVTIAAAAFHWAGYYDATATQVVKADGTTTPGSNEHEVEVPAASQVRVQAVWRNQDVVHDWEVVPLQLTVEYEDGTLETFAAEPRPVLWTNTAELGVVGPTNLTVTVTGPVGVDYEFRAVVQPVGQHPVTVSRDGDEIVVSAEADVSVRITDVFDAPLPDLSLFPSPFPSHVDIYEGNVDERVIAVWDLVLAAGQEVRVSAPQDVVGPGPYRWTATTADGWTTMGVEPDRNEP